MVDKNGGQAEPGQPAEIELSEIREGVVVINSPGLPAGFIPPSASLSPTAVSDASAQDSGITTQPDSDPGE